VQGCKVLPRVWAGVRSSSGGKRSREEKSFRAGAWGRRESPALYKKRWRAKRAKFFARAGPAFKAGPVSRVLAGAGCEARAGGDYAACRMGRNGWVISSNHGWRWMAVAKFFMRK
jgi:hypothetical protein